LREVLLDELLQRQRAADALLPPEIFERPFECFRRVSLGEDLPAATVSNPDLLSGSGTPRPRRRRWRAF
jgi:hypothetical protein